MNAKEAALASDIVAEKARQEAKLAEEMKRKREEEEDRYARTKAVDYLLKQFHDRWLLDAIQKNERYCRVSHVGDRITLVIAKERLEKDGYSVSDITHEYHEAYGGSADDGCAYAHDAYSEWIVGVSW